MVLTVADLADFLLVRDLGVEVASISVVHDNAQAALVHERLFVSDDVGMAHGLEHVHLVDGVLPLLAVHLGDVDDFHDVSLSVVDGLDEDGESERAFADDLELAILLHMGYNSNLL